MSIWWIDEPFVAGGPNPTDDELGRLRAQGFSLLVCLLDEEEQRPRYDVRALARAGWVRRAIPVRDFHAPSLAQLDEFVDLVRAPDSTASVLVHCQGGSGRTGTMAAAYWIAKGLTADEAISRVRRVRPKAVETSSRSKYYGISQDAREPLTCRTSLAVVRALLRRGALRVLRARPSGPGNTRP